MKDAPPPAAPVPFDRDLLRRRKMSERRSRRPRPPDSLEAILIRRAASDLKERLRTVKRPFRAALALGEDAAAIAEKTPKPVILSLAPRLRRDHNLFVIGDEEALPFQKQSFDLILSVLSLHWANDLPGVLAQIRGALKPDGLFLAALFGANTLCELRETLLHAESAMTGGASPRIAPFPDLRAAGDLLPRAGFALSVADRDLIRLRYDGMTALLSDIRQDSVGNIMTARAKTPLSRAVLQEARRLYETRFRLKEGGARATFEILYLTAWAPAPGQAKPLKPGSAKMPLQDALRDIRKKRERKN